MTETKQQRQARRALERAWIRQGRAKRRPWAAIARPLVLVAIIILALVLGRLWGS